MILVDTSAWVDHLRNGHEALCERLLKDEVACHPMVIGVLACGNLKRRKELLALPHALPAIERVSDDEMLFSLNTPVFPDADLTWWTSIFWLPAFFPKHLCGQQPPAGGRWACGKCVAGCAPHVARRTPTLGAWMSSSRPAWPNHPAKEYHEEIPCIR